MKEQEVLERVIEPPFLMKGITAEALFCPFVAHLPFLEALSLHLHTRPVGWAHYSLLPVHS